MRISHKAVFLALNLALNGHLMAATAPSSVHTNKQSPSQQLQMLHCLADKFQGKYPVLGENKTYSILDVPQADVEKIAQQADKVQCGRFVNVSDEFAELPRSRAAKKAKAVKVLSAPLSKVQELQSYPITHQAIVESTMAKVNVSNILSTVDRLSTFFNRGASTRTGVDAYNWLERSFVELVRKSGRSDVLVWKLPTTGYLQPSLITMIGSHLTTPPIVIGAHIDTLSNGRMPGADDDASGAASTLEMARIIMESRETLKHPIYFIWYAAEEQGLVGSRNVVRNFFRNTEVKAVIQFDMTGYRPDPNDATIWLFEDDYINLSLKNFLENLINTYVHVPVGKGSRCGYGCSDHYSWTERRFPAIPVVFPAEAKFDQSNPAIHTPADTMDRLNNEHMSNFTKLGLAFAIELAFE